MNATTRDPLEREIGENWDEPCWDTPEPAKQYRAFYDPATGQAFVSERPPIGTPGAGQMYDGDYHASPTMAIANLVAWARELAADRERWFTRMGYPCPETVFHRIVNTNQHNEGRNNG